MYTDVLNLLTEFDAKLSRKDGKFVNTLPQVQCTFMHIHVYMYKCVICTCSWMYICKLMDK